MSGPQPVVVKGPKGAKVRLVEKKMRDRDFDPIDAMIDLCQHGEDIGDGLYLSIPLDIRVSLLKELAQYTYPKRKAIEIEADPGDVTFNIVSGIKGSPGSGGLDDI